MPMSESVVRTKVGLFGRENWHHFSSFSVVSCVLPGHRELQGVVWGSRGTQALQASSTAATDGREGYCPHAPLWDINKNSKNVFFSFFILFVSVHTSSFQFCLVWATSTVWRMSSKANCFQQNFLKPVYLVPLLCTHLFSLWFLCLPFEMVELFTPLYPIPHASRGNDDPSLPQRCC